MPFTPTNPETTQVPVEQMVDQAVNEYHVSDIIIHTDPNNQANTAVSVSWQKGYRDENEVFHVVELHQSIFTGAVLFNQMLQEVQEGRNLYDAIKYAAWELIISEQGFEGEVS